MTLTGYFMQQREKKKEKTEEYLIEKKVDCQIANLINNLIYRNCFYLVLMLNSCRCLLFRQVCVLLNDLS